MIVSERFEGQGWIWTHVRSQPGSGLEINVWAYGRGHPFASAGWSTFYGVSASTGKEQIRIVAGETEFRENTGVLMAPWPDGRVFHASTGNGEAGLYVLSWVAGNVSAWSYEIRGHGLVIDELATGNTSFLYLSHDFESPLAVEAYVEMGARVQPEAVKELRFEGLSTGLYDVKSLHRFVGLRDRGIREPTTALNWTDSKGVVRTCPCNWFMIEAPGFPRAEPGLHRFEFSTISAGDSQIDEISITGVDFGSFRSALWE